MPTRRPSACPLGHPVRRNGQAWWCWTCDREVAPRERPGPKLARGRIKPLGSQVKRARRSARTYGEPERLAWLHGLSCVALGLPGHQCGPWDMDLGRAVIQAVHVRARGAGGRADDQVPGCWVLHEAAGEWGTARRATLERDLGIDLVERAAFYAAEWRALKAERDGATLAE